jgi:hypothetical protein
VDLINSINISASFDRLSTGSSNFFCHWGDDFGFGENAGILHGESLLSSGEIKLSAWA